jgi:hypothetical protein
MQPQGLITASLKALRVPEPRNIIWKTTTVKQKGANANDTAVVDAFTEAHCRVLPAYRATVALYSATMEQLHDEESSMSKDYNRNVLFKDGKHYTPQAYRELNTVLLNMLA